MVVATSSSPRAVGAAWLAERRRVVAATLVERIGSAPLDPGAEMLIVDHGHVEGTVTGGCVESALVGEAEWVLRGDGARLVSYGISDDEAAGVGLMCSAARTAGSSSWTKTVTVPPHPCGLDLGARTPEETALSILAEVVAARTGRSGESLRATSGPIHGDTEPAEAIDTEEGP